MHNTDDRAADPERPRPYRVWSRTGSVLTTEPARYAGITTTRIFGRLTCSSGQRALSQNRVFFATYQDAIAAGYRPCLNCQPQPSDRYERGTLGWVLAPAR